MGQEFVVPSFNTNRYYNKNTENIAVLPTGLTAGQVIFVQSDGTLDGSSNFFWDNTNNRLGIGTATPGSILHILSSGATTLTIGSSGSNTLDRAIQFNNAAGSPAGYLIVVPNTVGTDSQMQMYVGGNAAGDIKMRINDSGQISVGNGASSTFNDIFTITRSSASDSTGGLQLNNSASGGYGSAINFGVNVLAPGQYTAGRIDLQNTGAGGGGYLAFSTAGVESTTLAEVARLYNDTFLIGRTSGTLSDGILQVTRAFVNGVAEKMAKFSLSEDTSSFMEILNASATNATLVPELRGTQSGTSAGLVLRGVGTTDTGSNPIVLNDARIGVATTVVTRPIFEWGNNGTAVLSILPLNSGANSCLSWGTQTGVVPAFTTRSNGTRLVLASAITDSLVDYAIGAFGGGTAGVWYSVPGATSGYEHRWYGGTTVLATLRGDGVFKLSSTATTYGRVGQKFEIDTLGNFGGAAFNCWSSTGGEGTIIDINRSKSASIGTQTILGNADLVGAINFRGSDGAAFIDAAQIQCAVDSTPGTNDMPGRLVFFTTPDGSTTLTERMRITSAGQVGIGVTPGGTSVLDVYGTSTTSFIAIQAGGGGAGNRFGYKLESNGAYGSITVDPDSSAGMRITRLNLGPLLIGQNDNTTFASQTFTEQMRLSTTGQVTFTKGAEASVAEVLAEWVVSDDAVGKFRFSNGTSTDAGLIPVFTGISAGTSYGLEIDGQAATDTGANPLMVFNSRIGASTTVATRPTFQWMNNASAVMTMTAAGNLKIAGTAVRGTTEGTNHLDIFDGTAPVGTLANGISLYSTAGELRVMDAAGNATLLSPHEKESNYWIYDSVHTPTGKKLKIDVEQLLKFINKEFGLNFVHES